jgi:type IV pilus assembly PilN-like protein
MITGEFRKWLSIGTGVGVEVRGGDLVVTVARVLPKGVRIVASTEVSDFRERPASEWGAELNKFLKDIGSGHLACTVLLPRAEIIVRQISLPGVGRKDLDAAIRFQVDSLHPYPEDEVTYAWVQVPDTPVIVIGIARRDVTDHYAALFAEAGMRTAAFTFSAAVDYTAIRMLSTPPPDGFLILEQHDGEWEAYGESPARPVFSAAFDFPPERVLALAASELRLNPDTEPVHLVDLLPKPVRAPEEWDLGRYAASYATALTGACPWLALSPNLLPAEKRSRNSRAVYAPTVALAAILVIMLGALGAFGGMKDRNYVSAVESETARFTPAASRVAEIDAEIERLRARRDLIRKFSIHTRDDLNSMLDLTYLFEPPAYLRDVRIERNSVTVTGEAPEAAKLLEILDASPLFRNSEFTSPISDAGDMQRFTVRLQRETPEAGGAE